PKPIPDPISLLVRAYYTVSPEGAPLPKSAPCDFGFCDNNPTIIKEPHDAGSPGRHSTCFHCRPCLVARTASLSCLKPAPRPLLKPHARWIGLPVTANPPTSRRLSAPRAGGKRNTPPKSAKH